MAFYLTGNGVLGIVTCTGFLFKYVLSTCLGVGDTVYDSLGVGVDLRAAIL